MFARLGHLTFRRRRTVLGIAAAVAVFAVVWGTGVFGALSGGGFVDEHSESARARAAAAAALGRDDADVIALYRSADLTVADPSFRAAVDQTLAALPAGEVTGTTTFWSTNAPQLVSKDRHATYAVLQLAGADDNARMKTYDRIKNKLDAPGLTLQRGGAIATNADVSEQVGKDIGRAEALSMPILLVLLVLIFGGLVAAGLPLAIGGLGILGAFTILRVLTLFTDVSVFAINIITMLGLGLSIDYALFVVSRFREELGRGLDVESAVVRTMQTAGRTVAFSGITVMVSLSSLLLFPQLFLRSMGVGGMAAVLVAMTAALTVLPALLGVIGHRVDALRVFRRRRGTAATTESGAWSRVAHSVMRRPVIYAGVIVVLLLALGTPFLRVTFGGIDARVMPKGAEARVVSESLRQDFDAAVPNPVVVVVAGASQSAVTPYVQQLSRLGGARDAHITGSAGDTTRIAVGYDGLAVSDQARSLVRAIRATPPPAGADVLVGGQSAELVDLLHGLGAKLPWMALFVGLTTFILLFLAFGSVVLPIKALVMNTLSLGATFGAIVWVFQDGHLSGLLHFTPTGTVEATQPILMLAMAFGLSMDYEVFLLSRIREQWDRTGDNAVAVATGLQRTGRIITSAALLLVVVFAGFATSGITFIKMIGIGMVIAVIVDATVVRALLVPATMRLLGNANWYAPAPLRRLYDRIGFRETDATETIALPTPRPETEPANA